MSGSSEADPEGGQGSVWVTGVAAERGGEVDRPELLTLLTSTNDERQRQRRLEAARRELASLEVTWPLLEEDEPDGP